MYQKKQTNNVQITENSDDEDVIDNETDEKIVQVLIGMEFLEILI